MADNARAGDLREQLIVLRNQRAPEIDLKPASVYEAVTRQMVESLAADLREIKERLNGLLWMVAGTLLAEVVTKVLAASR
jgi:hypothetical protein